MPRWLTTLCLILACSPAGPETDDEALRIVDEQVAAFNQHDVGAMTDNLGADFRWWSISADSVSLEVGGRDDFRVAMADYFEAIPSARSAVEEVMRSGAFVAIRERAFWTSGDEERSQISIGVYEVRDGKIQTVWYFPAQP